MHHNTYSYDVYTLSGDTVTLCGKETWWYPGCLYECDGNGLVVYDGGFGSMRVEFVYLYTLTDGKLEMSEVLVSTEDSSWGELEKCLDAYTNIQNYYSSTDYTPLLGK